MHNWMGCYVNTRNTDSSVSMAFMRKHRCWRIFCLITLLSMHIIATPKAHALTAPLSYYLMDITGNFSSPARVATDLNGNIYIPDENTREVSVLSPSGNRLFSIPGAAIPRSVAVDAQGRILVGYMNYGEAGYVAMFDQSGRFLRYLGSGAYEFAYPSDIAISYRTGRIYVLDNLQNTVKVYEGNGEGVINATGARLTIGKFGHNYARSPLASPGLFDYPTGVAVDDIRQEVLVSDQNNFRVQIFGFDGSFKTAFGKSAPDTSSSFGNVVYDLRGTFSAIRGLTVDKEGRIYVVDAFQCTVQVLDRTGLFLAFIGEYGSGIGGLKTPLDATIDINGRLLVVDWNNNRLSIFQTDSEPAIHNLPPTVPALLAPANAVQLNTTTPVLSVFNANDLNRDPLTYEFQVDISPSFTSANLISFFASEGIGNTSATVPALADHTMYFWRARTAETSTADLYTSAWSEPRSFYLNAVNRPPLPPASLWPVSGSPARKTDSLSWGPSADPDLYDTFSYTVEISERPTFDAVLMSKSGLSGTSARIDSFNGFESSLKSGVTYYWRVLAADNHGALSFSAAGSFVFKQTLLRITSTQPAAAVYLDGNYEYLGAFIGLTGGLTGVEPVEVKEIKPGRHVVRIEKAGHFGFYTSLDILEGEITVVDAALVAATNGARNFQGRLRDESGAGIGGGSPLLDHSKPFVVDWNNDGRKDLLIGDESGKVYLYANIATDGSPALSLSQAYPGGVVVSGGSKAAPFVVDWDNDGRKDLLTGSSDGTVRLYLNQGSDETPSFTSFTNLHSNGAAIQVSGNAAPFVVDWDNDGRKDLLIGERSGRIRLFLNTSDDASPVFDVTLDIAQGVSIQMGGADLRVTGSATACVADWNHDGKKDLLAGSSRGMWVFLNTMTDAAPSFNLSASYYMPADTAIAPILVDYNSDGFGDLLLGESNGGIRYYEFMRRHNDQRYGNAASPFRNNEWRDSERDNRER